MGCCPIFKNNAKVADLQSSTLGPEHDPQNSEGCAQLRKASNVQAPPTIEIESPQGQPQLQQISLSNHTEHQLRPPSPAADMQSNLEIAVSASGDNEEQIADSVAFQPHQEQKMILLAHSKIRQSMVHRWQQPQFNVEELFVPIDFDRLFQIGVKDDKVAKQMQQKGEQKVEERVAVEQ